MNKKLKNYLQCSSSKTYQTMISEKGDEYWFQMGKLQGFIQANEILSSRAYPHNTDVRPTIKSIQVDIQQWISYLRELLGYENEISEVNK